MPKIPDPINFESSRPIFLLTQQQALVYGCLADRMSTKEIASMLLISSKTVESHIQNIKVKTGSKSTVELRARAVEERVKRRYEDVIRTLVGCVVCPFKDRKPSSKCDDCAYL